MSQAHRVDHERIALSNQFMSKTARNLASNPRPSLLLVDPVTGRSTGWRWCTSAPSDEGTCSSGCAPTSTPSPRTRGCRTCSGCGRPTIFRVRRGHPGHPRTRRAGRRRPARRPRRPGFGGAASAAAAELIARIGRCDDLDVLVDTTLDGLDRAARLPPRALPAARRDGSPPVHHRQPRLRRRQRWRRGRGRRRPDRRRRGSLRAGAAG